MCEKGHKLLPLFLGLCFGLILIKSGNPANLDHLLQDDRLFNAISREALDVGQELADSSQTQRSLFDVLVSPWRLSSGIVVLAIATLASLKYVSFQWKKPLWFIVLFGVWYFWQHLSALDTIDPPLTSLALWHFSGCLLSLGLGCFVLSRCQRFELFWLGPILGMLIVFWVGLQQHYGGLDSLRRMIYEQTDYAQLPPELLKRLSKGRIFSTFVYPNALAGAILLLLPACLYYLWQLIKGLPNVLKAVITGMFAYTGIACLVWSGSKAGWLILLVIGFVAISRLPINKRIRQLSIPFLLALGLVAFGIKYRHYFVLGATSVSARFDYWHAAIKIFSANPWTGTGPGTFSKSYPRYKAPESEMARLTHNDFLEQACDSGAIGFLSYLGAISGGFFFVYRKSRALGWPFLVVWLGVGAWFLQGLVEFGLYIPALAWPAFLLFGWMIGFENDDVIVATKT
jgi:hypothetical protein